MTRTEAPFRRTLDVRLHESVDDGALRRALNEAGCAVTRMGHAGPRAGLPDAYVADLRGADRPLSIVGRARQAAGAVPLVLVTGADPLLTLAEPAERHGLVQVAGDPDSVIRALGRAVRSSDLAREAGLRLSAMTALEHPLAAEDASDAEAGVVVLAEPSPLALETLHLLEPSFGPDGVLSRAQALRALEAGEAGALVIVGAQARRDAAALVRLVRRQSVLREVPVVVVEARRTARHVAYWNAAGVDGCFLPDEGPLIEAALRSGLRRRAMNRRLRSLLTRTVLSDAGAESRIVGSRLFDACLTERCRRGAAPFAVGAIRMMPPSGVEAASSALSEAAVYLSFGVSAEDLMARPTPDLFLFQINSADLHGAARSLKGLSGLVGDLKFGEEDDFTTFRCQTAVAAWRAGDGAEGLVARALNGLREKVALREDA